MRSKSFLGRGHLAFVLAFSFATVVARPVRAQTVVDQQQLAYQYGYPLYGKWNTQSFSPGYSNSSGAGFLLQIGYPFGGPLSTTVSVNLWTKMASNPEAIRLAGGTTILNSVESGTPTWADVFWSPVSVTLGETYWLTLATSDTSFISHVAMDYTGVSNEYMSPAEGEYYSGGMAGHTDWFVKEPMERSSYELQSAQDLVFRTFATVPEPAPLGLIATGIGLLGVVSIKRRRPL